MSWKYQSKPRMIAAAIVHFPRCVRFIRINWRLVRVRGFWSLVRAALAFNEAIGRTDRKNLSDAAH